MPVQQTSGQVFGNFECLLITGTYDDWRLLCECGIPVMDATGVADRRYGCSFFKIAGSQRGIVHDLVVSDRLHKGDRYPHPRDLPAFPALDRRSHYAQGGAEAAMEGVLFIVLLFACVLLHEFGHVFAARTIRRADARHHLAADRRRGAAGADPGEAAQELVVALAGPAVNMVIAALLFLALGGMPSTASMESTIREPACWPGWPRSMCSWCCST